MGWQLGIETETAVFQHAQCEGFRQEVHALKAHKPVNSNICLRTFALMWDPHLNLIRMGGTSAILPEDALHFILLAPTHPITKL